MCLKKSFMTCAAVAVVCTVGGLLTGFASVDADTVNAVDAVAAIQRVAPGAVAGSAATDENDGLSVTVPTDAVDGIQLTGGDASALTVGLPFARTASDAAESQVAGVVVYDNNNGSSTVPVIRDGGVQINTVIDNAGAPKRYDYPMGLPWGQNLQMNADGSVIAAGVEGAVSAYVEAPWAKDANGNPVPTHYEINGSTLTQVIDFTANTAFPVVADPKVTFGWGNQGQGLYLNLTGGEMKAVASAVVALGGGGVLAVCSGATKLPTVISNIAKLTCTAVGSVTLWSILKAIQSIASNPRYKYNTCYQTLLTAPGSWVATSRGNCSS